MFVKEESYPNSAYAYDGHQWERATIHREDRSNPAGNRPGGPFQYPSQVHDALRKFQQDEDQRFRRPRLDDAHRRLNEQLQRDYESEQRYLAENDPGFLPLRAAVAPCNRPSTQAITPSMEHPFVAPVNPNPTPVR